MSRRCIAVLTRRRFLCTVALASGAAASGACRRAGSDQSAGGPAEPPGSGSGGAGEAAVAAIRARVREVLPYLRLGDQEVDLFASELIADEGEGRAIGIDAEVLATRLLLSTDFFATGADVDRAPQWVGYYSAWRRPCANPFARME